MTEEQQDYEKNGFCEAPTAEQCINFEPVHDLHDACKYCGLGCTCEA